MIFRKLLIIAAVLLWGAAAAYAGDKQLPCDDCGIPENRVPKCEVVKIHFTQPEAGPVLLQLWNGEGQLILDRSNKDELVKKSREDWYGTCIETVKQAVRVRIGRCPPTFPLPPTLTFEGDVLGEYQRSAGEPIKLP